ncbi:hypothetical protein F2Q70_00009902 [Brassica cretica]|uniref:Uncharacterized protein n=1 Tax=Brassica cretica TaxID=69181 RepID=A0A8S9LRU7_BRACR|nr:hypothetical protein F2Q70_00009902 [Brassica cretica]
MEKAKQDDGLADLSDLLGNMVESGMRRAAISCGIEIAFLLDEKCHKTLWSRDNRIHKLTKELSVEIQVSFFEEANNAHYNSVSIGYVDEVTSVFIGSCIFLMGQYWCNVLVCYLLGSTVSRGSSSYGTEYCFISLPLAVNFKTRDWIRVIIGVEARKGMLEIM